MYIVVMYLHVVKEMCLDARLPGYIGEYRENAMRCSSVWILAMEEN